MSVTQLIAAQVETLLYSKIHDLLGVIADDFELDHGLLVEKYLVRTREGSPPPQFIYKATEGSVAGDCEDAPVKKPKKAKKSAKVKVTKAKSESDDDREGKCTSKTAKGTLCRNKAFGGGCTCRVHTPKEKEEGEVSESEEKPKKAKRSRKVKAKEPEHSHKMDELAASDCELCETHGNPKEGDQEFEVPKEDDKRAAIRKMLEEEFEGVSEEEVEEAMAELEEVVVEKAESDSDYVMSEEEFDE